MNFQHRQELVQGGPNDNLCLLSMFESLILNGSFKNHNPSVFSNLPPSKISIFVELVHSLSQLKFDGEGGTFLSKHINDFLGFYKYFEVNNEDVMFILFTLTL